MKEYTEEKLDVWHWRINVLQILSVLGEPSYLSFSPV